ncbi:MAG TPA: bifunctional polysaccharide deacetylase/glycosyltransferase family 2 protein [Candidatus Paceibacterota bacterium]|nr:bifunctional polysaccharide deacetylase/glycosyltransferase family 2 protein [Candidatus Paceibacterota bacterium]
MRIIFLLVGGIVFFSLWQFAHSNRDLTGVCTTCTYSAYLTQSIPPKEIAITIDDGPDQNTMQILNTLDETHTPATFFLIGQYVARYPNLVKEISKRGYTIGNHTFTHAPDVQSSDKRIAWELDSTNKLIEALTGHAARLYRPPFLLDMDTTNTVRPILSNEPAWQWVREHGYITVGRDIETLDWQATTPEQVVQDVNAALDRKEQDPRGSTYHVMLLHSKPETAAAMPQILATLKARGYTVVPLEQVLGISREDAMPPSEQSASQSAFIAHFLFMFSSLWEIFLFSVIVIVLFTLVRPILFLGIKRFVPDKKEEIVRRAIEEQGGLPNLSISVLVPAYNEAENIQGTILSILSNTHRPDEIIVLDDGSKDSTNDRAQEIADFYPDIVRVISLQNGGKAKAMNAGIEYARGDIIICIDGDTVLDETCIEKILPRFADPRIGAVAGKVIPALQKNTFQKIQYLEYTVMQNIDKEALARLGAVNVVAGAIGAWRRDVLAEVGGYSQDTLVEDQDITLAVLALGYKVDYEPEALAYTEVPTTVKDFFLQRLRWMYGTFQCVWKYRAYLFSFRRPVLGFVVMPFSFCTNVLFPLMIAGINLMLIVSAILYLSTPALIYIFLFTLFDMSYAFLAFGQEKNPKLRYIWYIPFQRILFILIYSVLTALVVMKILDGSPTKWNKLLRSGTAGQFFFDRINQSGGASAVPLNSWW